jgi:hypothetical protein
VQRVDRLDDLLAGGVALGPSTWRRLIFLRSSRIFFAPSVSFSYASLIALRSSWAFSIFTLSSLEVLLDRS